MLNNQSSKSYSDAKASTELVPAPVDMPVGSTGQVAEQRQSIYTVMRPRTKAEELRIAFFYNAQLGNSITGAAVPLGLVRGARPYKAFKTGASLLGVGLVTMDNSQQKEALKRRIAVSLLRVGSKIHTAEYSETDVATWSFSILYLCFGLDFDTINDIASSVGYKLTAKNVIDCDERTRQANAKVQELEGMLSQEELEQNEEYKAAWDESKFFFSEASLGIRDLSDDDTDAVDDLLAEEIELFTLATCLFILAEAKNSNSAENYGMHISTRAKRLLGSIGREDISSELLPIISFEGSRMVRSFLKASRVYRGIMLSWLFEIKAGGNARTQELGEIMTGQYLMYADMSCLASIHTNVLASQTRVIEAQIYQEELKALYSVAVSVMDASSAVPQPGALSYIGYLKRPQQRLISWGRMARLGVLATFVAARFSRTAAQIVTSSRIYDEMTTELKALIMKHAAEICSTMLEQQGATYPTQVRDVAEVNELSK